MRAFIAPQLTAVKEGSANDELGVVRASRGTISGELAQFGWCSGLVRLDTRILGRRSTDSPTPMLPCSDAAAYFFPGRQPFPSRPLSPIEQSGIHPLC